MDYKEWDPAVDPLIAAKYKASALDGKRACKLDLLRAFGLPQNDADMPLIGIMFYSQVINGAILPVILVFMLLLVNDRRIMGKYVNGLAMNILSWLTVAVLTILTLAMIIFMLI